jgi:ubiquinone/menaquinone biosynthesis C-methylase UbiE
VNSQFRVDSDAYDDFMGRYSRQLAVLFAEFAGASSGMRVLDVGAGTGALAAELVARGASVAAADPSPEFVAAFATRFPDVEVHEAPADEMPFEDGAFDLALAQLVVAFVPDGPAAVAEMARVARRSSSTHAPSPPRLRPREHGGALGSRAHERDLDFELALHELDVASRSVR